MVNVVCFFILVRHDLNFGNRTPPHMIELRANVSAISSCNPDIIMSVNSVGTMREDFPPGHIGISKTSLILHKYHGHSMMITYSILTGLVFLISML